MSIEFMPGLEVDETLRQQFRTGSLAREWHEKYPEIFDDDDLRLALSQPLYHFYEWFAALHLYQYKGCFSLIEQYQYRNHKRKQTVLQKLDSEDLRRAIAYRRLNSKVQLPDLLVYKPDFSDWFFCEVKGGNDKLRKEQKEHFEFLSALSGKSVYIIKVNPVIS